MSCVARFFLVRKAQESQRKQANEDEGGAQASGPANLRSLVYAEIPLDADTTPGAHVGWAFSLLASLIILAGPATLSEKDYLRFVLRAIPLGASYHRWLPLRSLHGFLWRCLVWAFSLTPYMSRPKSMVGINDWRNKLRHRTTEYIQQAHALDVGPCLIHALLGKNETPFSPALADHLPRRLDVTRTIDVLKGLIGHRSDSFFVQGLEVLLRVTSGVGADISSSRKDCSTWDLTAPLITDLLHGVLVDIEVQNMKHVLQSSTPFDISSIRLLCSAEIEEHWVQFLDIWVPAARRVFNADKSELLQHKVQG